MLPGDAPSLDGRRFASATAVEGGDVGAGTVFEYAQDGDLVHARYTGGAVRLGFLVGRREGDRLEFRYAHLTEDGRTAAGHCRSRVEVRPGGALRLHETWAWDSQPGAGTSVLDELV